MFTRCSMKPISAMQLQLPGYIPLGGIVSDVGVLPQPADVTHQPDVNPKDQKGRC